MNNVKINPLVGVLIIVVLVGGVLAAMWFASEAPKADKPALPPWVKQGVQDRLKKAEQAKAAHNRPAGVPEKPAAGKDTAQDTENSKGQ